MKHVFKVLVIVLVMLICVTQVALAGDYITDAVKALQDSTIYISPEVIGTYGVDNDTAGKLGAMLWSDDNIVLVMLPAEAAEGTDIYTLAQRLSEGLGNQRTIGLAVGREVIGYGPLLPSGVAADQMRRADSVSNNPVTALMTYAKNMHIWLEAHPQPTPTPTPAPTPMPVASATEESNFPWLVVMLGVGGVVIVVVVLTLRSKASAALAMSKRVRDFKPTIDLIKKIQGNVAVIRDSRICSELSSACKVAQGLVERLLEAQTPQGYTEEKFPDLIENLDLQVRALLGHESGKHPIPQDLLRQLKDGLLTYDDLFIGLQKGDPESVKLMASIIDTNNATIQTLGYMPKDR